MNENIIPYLCATCGTQYSPPEFPAAFFPHVF